MLSAAKDLTNSWIHMVLLCESTYRSREVFKNNFWGRVPTTSKEKSPLKKNTPLEVLRAKIIVSLRCSNNDVMNLVLDEDHLPIATISCTQYIAIVCDVTKFSRAFFIGHNIHSMGDNSWSQRSFRLGGHGPTSNLKYFSFFVA